MSRPAWDWKSRNAEGACTSCATTGNQDSHKAWCVHLEPWTPSELAAMKAPTHAAFCEKWRVVMYRKVGYQPRAAMPAVLTDRQWIAKYRASVTARLEAPSADSRRDLGAWNAAVASYGPLELDTVAA